MCRANEFPAEEDELTRFLNIEPLDDKVENVLQWWNDRHHEYPRLSRMASDFLSIPRKRQVSSALFLTHIYF